ncbi:serine hydroxymethyltransferase [Candidatus Babeliales bacterium]|nr:serine hydroxymethyltransferase [Candidatus Babeliales bacterium]
MSSCVDTEILSLITQEEERQQNTLNLIASENYASACVRKPLSSVLTNKYAEGYPGKRYYAGCENADAIEQCAIDRAKLLFGADHANVQPHSGSQANMAVYMTALAPGDTIMGMSLAEGGHLTHGHSVSFSGIFYRSHPYTVDRTTERLDYDAIQAQALKVKPKIIVTGASAYSRTIDFKAFSDIAQSVDAVLLADIAHIAGFVVTGLHPSPVPHADFVTSTTHKTLRGPRGGLILCNHQYSEKIDKAVMPGIQGGPFMQVIAAKAIAFREALDPSFIEYQKQVILNAKTLSSTLQGLGYRIVSGGTDNHLFIVDLTDKGISGRDAERILSKAGITVSRSCIPFDPAKPWITSGIRLGTPAVTTRGLKQNAMKQIGLWIHQVLNKPHGDHSRVRQNLMTLFSKA